MTTQAETAMTLAEVAALLRKTIDEWATNRSKPLKPSVKRWARAHRQDFPHIYNVLNQKAKPGKKLRKMLGIEPETYWRKVQNEK